MDEASAQAVTSRPSNATAGIIDHAHTHQGQRDRGAGEGQHIESELAHLQRHRRLFPERHARWPRSCGSSLRATWAWPLVQRACCARQAAAVCGNSPGTTRSDSIAARQPCIMQRMERSRSSVSVSPVQPPPSSIAVAVPDTGGAVERDRQAGAEARFLFDREMRVQQQALHPRQPVGVAVGMAPARLHEGQTGIGQQRRHGAASGNRAAARSRHRRSPHRARRNVSRPKARLPALKPLRSPRCRICRFTPSGTTAAAPRRPARSWLLPSPSSRSWMVRRSLRPVHAGRGARRDPHAPAGLHCRREAAPAHAAIPDRPRKGARGKGISRNTRTQASTASCTDRVQTATRMQVSANCRAKDRPRKRPCMAKVQIPKDLNPAETGDYRINEYAGRKGEAVPAGINARHGPDARTSYARLALSRGNGP